MHFWMVKKIVTSNFKILSNFPETLLQTVKSFWEIDCHNLKDSNRFKYYRPDEYQDYIVLKRNHALYDKFNLLCSGMVYLKSDPRAGLGPIHIDSGRGCAINIPIQVDLNNSHFFVANTECTERDFFDKEVISPGSKRYEYEPEKYSYYNLRQACILNTKQPHGFANYSDSERILLSISFSESYEDVIKNLPNEWF